MILTRKELAEQLKVSPQTIMNWEKNGLPTIRQNQIVRYDLNDVREWLKAEIRG